MPSEWRPSWNRWIDERRMIIWIFPLSCVAVVGQLFLGGYSARAIWVEEFGEAITRKAALLLVAGLYIAIMFYLSIGFFQMFFVELRQKFISREVIWDDSIYRLKGYYFKRAEFTPADIAAVEEYRVGHRYLSSTILTLLNRTPKVNYKVTLKDGRTYYLPGDMERVNELKALLEADIRAGFTP